MAPAAVIFYRLLGKSHAVKPLSIPLLVSHMFLNETIPFPLQTQRGGLWYHRDGARDWRGLSLVCRQGRMKGP